MKENEIMEHEVGTTEDVANPENEVNEMTEVEKEKFIEAEEVNIGSAKKVKKSTKKEEPKKNSTSDDLEMVKMQLQSIMEMMKNNDVYKKRIVFSATKKEKERMYKSPKVVTSKGVKAKTEADILKDEMSQLKQAAKASSPKILQGIVTGITPGAYGLAATIKQLDTTGSIRIMMPLSQLFYYDPKKEYIDRSPNSNYLRDEGLSRIGSQIDFCVYAVHEKEKIAIASRLHALQIIANRNYIKLQSDDSPEIKEGMIAQGRVIGIHKDRIKLNVLGADCVIKSGRELSWQALADLRSEFKMNDLLNVKITKIKEKAVEVDNKTFKLVDIEASVTGAMTRPEDKYYDTYNIGQYIGATIKNVDDDHGVFVNAIDTGMTMLCPFPKVGRPTIGSSCTILIKDKNDESKRISGVIIQMF